MFKEVAFIIFCHSYHHILFLRLTTFRMSALYKELSVVSARNGPGAPTSSQETSVLGTGHLDSSSHLSPSVFHHEM